MIDVTVCIGSACHVNGSNNVVMTFQHLIEQYDLHDKINLSGAFCMNKCTGKDVAVKVNGETYRINADAARAFFKETILPLVK